MKIHITGKGIEIGSSLHQHAEQGIQTLMQQYFGDILDASIVFSKQNSSFHVDITVHVSHHFTIRASVSKEDAYMAFDACLHKLEKRMSRYKSKLRDHKRHANHHTKEVLMANQYVIQPEYDYENPNDGAPAIIAEVDRSIPVLSVEEAVMQMELSESVLVMFKNAKNSQLNVVYKREDGNIGWLDPSLQ